MYIELPENVKSIIEVLYSNGYKAYAVGGCVRDSVLGRKPKDWDITTSALPQEVKSLFKKTIDTGIKHGTVTVMIKGEGYEVTTYRIDGVYKDGRHPENVTFSSKLTEDLQRRDFTINAMAYNDKVGLVDQFEGMKDLQEGIIRCVGNPSERFGEDALRMMRAIRFCAQLGFHMDDNTYKAIVQLAPNIIKVSVERIQVELVKTLLSENPDYVQKFQEAGLFIDILPKIDKILSGKYKKSTLTMLKLSEPTAIFRYAALFYSIGYEDIQEILKSLKLDNYTIDTVSKLVSYSKNTIEENEPAVREALHKYGKDMLNLMLKYEKTVIATKEAVTGILLPARKKHLAVIENMVSCIIERGDCFTLKDLDITGNDLIEYGLKGKEVGRVLGLLLDIVIENQKLNDKQTLIALIEHL